MILKSQSHQRASGGYCGQKALARWLVESDIDQETAKAIVSKIPDRAFVSLAEIKLCLETSGFNVEYVTQIPKARKPVIVWLPRGHFVVLLAQQKGECTVFDPDYPNETKRWSIDRFGSENGVLGVASKQY